MMPHTSRNKKPAHRKRTQTVDEEGWTRISSNPYTMRLCPGAVHVMVPKGPYAEPSRLDPHPIADGMNMKTLQERYRIIESKWQISEACKQLSKALRKTLQANPNHVNTCVCFGTGSMSGLKDGWIARHHVALYQIAVFKSAVNAIEEAQSHRPSSYAQEPRYNVLDREFLADLHITTTDSPNGWEAIDSSSFTYCPGAEQFVSIMTLKKDPAFYLAGPLQWLRDQQVEVVFPLPMHCQLVHKDSEEMETLAIIDTFVAGHDVYKLPDLDAPDHPCYDQVLYTRKPVDS